MSTLMTWRADLAAAGKSWDDVRAWALGVRSGKTLRWTPKQLDGRPAGVAIAYLEAGCPDADTSVLRGRGVASDLGGVFRHRGDSRARGIEAANQKPASAVDLCTEHGLDWPGVVRPWALRQGYKPANVKPQRPHQGAVLAYLKAHPEHAESAAS